VYKKGVIMADEPEVVESETTEEPPKETPKETTPEETPEVEGEGEEQPEPEAEEVKEGEPKSERGKKRVQDLANKAKAETERADKSEEEVVSLRDEIASIGSEKPKEETTQVKGTPVGGEKPPWIESIPVPEPGAEITPDKYREDVINAAGTIVQANLANRDRRDLIKDNLTQDMNYLEKTYPEAFDSDDKELKVAFKKSHENFLKAVQADPNVRFKDFADPILKARSQGVEQGKEAASAKLAEQKAESAIKPEGKTPDRVSSTEELEKMIASGEIDPEEAEKRYPDLLL